MEEDKLDNIIIDLKTDLRKFLKKENMGGKFDDLILRIKKIKLFLKKQVSSNDFSSSLVSSPIFSVIGFGNDISIGSRLYGVKYEELDKLQEYIKEQITKPVDVFLDANKDFEPTMSSFASSISSGKVTAENDFFIDIVDGKQVVVDKSNISEYLNKTNELLNKINSDFDKFSKSLQESLELEESKWLSFGQEFNLKRKNSVVRDSLNSSVSVEMPGVFGRATPSEYFQKQVNAMSYGLKKINENKLSIENILLSLRAFKSIELISSRFNSLASSNLQSSSSSKIKKVENPNIILSAKIGGSVLSINSLFYKKNNQIFLNKKSSSNGEIVLNISKEFYSKLNKVSKKYRKLSFLKAVSERGELSFSGKLDLSKSILEESCDVYLKRSGVVLLAFDQSILSKAEKFYSEDSDPSPIISFPYLNIEVYAKETHIKKKSSSSITTSFYETKTPSGDRITFSITDLIKNQGKIIDPKTKKKFKPKLNKSKGSSLSEVVKKWNVKK